VLTKHSVQVQFYGTHPRLSSEVGCRLYLILEWDSGLKGKDSDYLMQKDDTVVGVISKVGNCISIE